MREVFRKTNKKVLIGAAVILMLILFSLFPSAFATHDPVEIDVYHKLEKPSREHWLGTDQLGRDIYSRLIYGTSVSLTVGFASLAIGGNVGLLLGLVAGFYGGWIDGVIMRLMDILLAFPGILLALALVGALGADLKYVLFAVGLFAVPIFARTVRGSTLAVCQMEYVEAVRALGAGDLRLLLGHVLPNVLPIFIVQASLYMATAILVASGLSFLGLGAQPPTPEWGAMLDRGRQYLWEAPHVAFFPGLAIAVTVIAFNLLGDGLRDVLDPVEKR